MYKFVSELWFILKVFNMGMEPYYRNGTVLWELSRNVLLSRDC